jgi:hypothetical protein
VTARAKPGAHPAGFALLLTLSMAQFMMEEGSLRSAELSSVKMPRHGRSQAGHDP